MAKTLKLTEFFIRDPFILPDAESGQYFLYATAPVKATTRGQCGTIAYRSRDLVNWSEPTLVYEAPTDFWADTKHRAWAPEVHRYKDRYYLFTTFTAPQGKPNTPPRATQILIADKPEGPFRAFANKPHTPLDWMSLDGTLWVEDGKPWMVFCHEWVQITDGTMELVQLKDDLSDVEGEPKTLFRATDAPWTRDLASLVAKPTGKERHGTITDGPFLYRTKTGKLLMIWSSFGERRYAVGVAHSESGRIAGPWRQEKEPIFAANGGHAMLFKTFEGTLAMTLHQPNNKDARARLFEVEDTGDTLRVVGKLALKE